MSYKLKDILKLNLSTRGGVKRFNNIVNKYIINKKEKKELFKEVKNINKGEDSFDDGMEYYKVNFNGVDISDIDVYDILSNFFIASIAQGKLYLGINFNEYGVGYMFGNAKLILFADTTSKDYTNTKLEEHGLSLNDKTRFEPITAKEFYSLLD